MPKTQMFDPTTFTEGGGASLNGVEGVIVGSKFMWTNWAKDDGSIPVYKKGPNKGEPVKPSTVHELLVKTDELDDPIRALISVSSVLVPSKDGVTAAKDKEGPFLVHPDGKDATLNKNSAEAMLIESLVNASFDYELMNEDGVGVLEGYRLAFEEVQRKDSKGEDLGRPIALVTKIVHGPGKSAKAKKGAAPAPTKKGKPKPEPEEEEEETGEVDIEATVTEIITGILADESPLPKAKVNMKLNKALAEAGLEQKDRMAALKLGTSEEFLAAGPWNFNAKAKTISSLEE